MSNNNSYDNNAILVDYRVKTKESEKIEKYLDFSKREKNMEYASEGTDMRGRIEIIQTVE